MKKIILINILMSMLFLGCSSDTIKYLPAVIYLKSPQIVSMNGENKTFIEFAISDLNELEGSVELTVTDSSNKIILNHKMDKLLFSTDGTLISFYDNEITNTDDLNFKFNICNKSKECKIQNFNKVRLNTSDKTDEINIKGQIISDNNFYNFKIFLSSIKTIIPNKTDGSFEIDGINSGKYDLYTDGKDTSDGFYRYTYLSSILFDKSTKIYLYIPLDKNQKYDNSYLGCSYASTSNNNSIFLLFIVILIIIKSKFIENKKL